MRSPSFLGQLQLDAGLGINATNDRGFWGAVGMGGGVIIREGDPVVASGVNPGVSYGQPNVRIVANRAEEIAFSTNVVGNGGANVMLLAGAPGDLRLVAQRSDSPFGLTISSFEAASICEFGNVIFRATLSGEPSTSNTAVFVEFDEDFVLPIAQEGLQVPDQPKGVVFDRFGDMHCNEEGIVFFAYFRGEGVDSSSDGAIMRAFIGKGKGKGKGGGFGFLETVVREGDIAANTDGAVINLLPGIRRQRLWRDRLCRNPPQRRRRHDLWQQPRALAQQWTIPAAVDRPQGRRVLLPAIRPRSREHPHSHLRRISTRSPPPPVESVPTRRCSPTRVSPS